MKGSGFKVNERAGENLGNHKLVYRGVDGYWWLANADDVASMPVLGITMSAITTGMKGEILKWGYIGDNSWAWTAGEEIYASTTPGELTQIVPTGVGDVVQIVAIAVTDIIIEFVGKGGSGGEPWDKVTEASYIIFTDGTNIYAKNGTTGQIEFSGADAATVIQAANDALTNGGLIYLKGMDYPHDIIVSNAVNIITDKSVVPSFDRRKFVPLLTQTLGDVYENGRNLVFQPTNITYLHDLCYDPLTDHIWGITRASIGGVSDNYILKINRIDGTYTTILIGASSENMGMACCYANGYVWFALLTAPAKIIKLNPIDDTYVTYTMNAGEDGGTSICFDGQYIYMGLNLSPAKLIKFNPADNTHTTYTMDANENGFYWILWDGTYVWAVGNVGAPGTAGILVRFDPATDLHVTYNFAADEIDPHHIAFDGNNIWVCFGTAPSKFIKFDIDAGTYKSFQESSNQWIYVLEFDGTYIWAGFNGGGYLLRIAPSDGSYERIAPLANLIPLAGLHCICFDGSHLWLGTYYNPTYIMKFTPFSGAQSKSVIRFDGNQTPQNFGETKYIGTLSLSATENIAQIPMSCSITVVGLSANIITNTLNDSLAIRLRRNGVFLDQLVYGAGVTGIVSKSILYRFDAGDLMSIQVVAYGAAGAANIGQITATIQ